MNTTFRELNDKNVTISKDYSLTIAQNLELLLDLYSINMLDLANKIDISYSAIYRTVHASSSPNFNTLVKIASFFNITIAELIGEIPIYKNKLSHIIKTVPIITWENVVDFLDNQQINSNNKLDKITVSSKHMLSNYCFGLYTNTKTENFFQKNTLLVFDKLKDISQNEDNKFILVVGENNIPYVRKVSIELEKIWLYPLDASLPCEVSTHYKILAVLIQAKTEY